MMRYIYGTDLNNFPLLRDTMFRDRAQQFKTRLNWEVTVDATGFEIDQYDAMNPLYAIWEMPDGTHGGSMRFLPTTGETMINDFFTHLTEGVKIQSPLIWECTRFCVSPRHEQNGAEIAAGLMLGGAEIGLRFGLTDWVGVFDARMVRIYRRIGWEPTVIGTGGEGRDRVSVGLWEVTEDNRDAVAAKSGYKASDAVDWFNASFPERINPLAA